MTLAIQPFPWQVHTILLSSLHHLLKNKLLVFSLAIWASFFTLAILLLSQQPWLGMNYKENMDGPGIVVTKQYLPNSAIKETEALISIESKQSYKYMLGRDSIFPKPGECKLFEEYDHVFAENRKLYKVLQSDSVLITTQSGKQHLIKPQSRPINTIPFEFWIMCLSTLVVLMVGAVLWNSQKNIVTGILLFTAWDYLFGMMSLATYSVRGLGLQPDVFMFLGAMDAFWQPIFSFMIAGVLLIYPRKIAPNWVVYAYFTLTFLVGLNAVAHWLEPPVHAFVSPVMFVAIPVLVIFGIWQRVLAHRRPADRATLRWYVLSVWIGLLFSMTFYWGPLFLGKSPEQGAWIMSIVICVVYIGFALGAARYKLFAVDKIWFKTWIWVFAGAIIVWIDVGLVAMFQLSQFASLNIAIFIVAWIYFPARQWLWGKLGKVPEPKLEQFLPAMAEAVFDRPNAEPSRKSWQAILDQAFNSLSIETKAGMINSPGLQADGEQLLVPNINPRAHTVLSGRSKGTRLFSPADVGLTAALFSLLKQLHDVRSAYDRGASEERDRVMRDLHDDVGANLLNMIYDAKSTKQADYARETLALLRETVHTVQNDSQISLNKISQQWNADIRGRLSSAEVELIWSDTLSEVDKEVSPALSLNLSRVLKELVSNLLKHSQANWLKLDVFDQDDALHIQLCHNGHIQALSSWVEGEGLSNIKNRLVKHAASIKWREECSADPQQSLLPAHIVFPYKRASQLRAALTA